MRKVSLKSNSVAYFDDPEMVEEPGFYLLEGDKEETDNTPVYEGGEFEVAGKDDNGNPVLATDDRGRPMFKTAPSLKERISVTHETNMTPGRRVYPAPDGDGFVDEEPEVGTPQAPVETWDTASDNGGGGS